jgi:Arc/MetJ-type ribon-helix-helix transcriptional regulator
MVRTQISMTEEQADGLRRLAASRKTSQAALLREALDALLAGDDRALRAARAASAIGRYRSGHHDTSADHDDIYAASILE